MEDCIREFDMDILIFCQILALCWIESVESSIVCNRMRVSKSTFNWWDCTHNLILLCKAIKLTSDVRVTTKPLLHQRRSLDVMSNQKIFNSRWDALIESVVQTTLYLSLLFSPGHEIMAGAVIPALIWMSWFFCLGTPLPFQELSSLAWSQWPAVQTEALNVMSWHCYSQLI